MEMQSVFHKCVLLPELGWLEPGVRWKAVREYAGRQVMSGAPRLMPHLCLI